MKKSFKVILSTGLLSLCFSVSAQAENLICVDKTDDNAGVIISTTDRGGTDYEIKKYLTDISLSNCADSGKVDVKRDFSSTQIFSYERNTKCMYLKTVAYGDRAREDHYSGYKITNDESKFSGPGDIHGVDRAGGGLDSAGISFKMNLKKGGDGTIEIKSAKLNVDFKMNVSCQ